MCQRIRSGLGVRMTFDLAAQLQLVQELRHLILVQAKRFLHGLRLSFTPRNARKLSVNCSTFEATVPALPYQAGGYWLIVTVRAFAESTARISVCSGAQPMMRAPAKASAALSVMR